MQQYDVAAGVINDCTDFVTTTTGIFFQYRYNEYPAINPEYLMSNGDGDASSAGEGANASMLE